MFTLVALIAFACVVMPALAWAVGLVFRIFGWTMRMVFGVLLLPLWILFALIGGLAVAAQALIPIAIVLFVLSIITAEN